MSAAVELAPAAGGVPLRDRLPVRGASIVRINTVIASLTAGSRASTQRNWLAAVARLVAELRPDLAEQLTAHLDVPPLDVGNPLAGMSIGEIGVVYEALMALAGASSRRQKGQYFTPDDVADHMAAQAARFPAGRWLDPCCGVGNLSWHLARAMPNPAEFVAEQLMLIDLDPIARRTAEALLVASFADDGDRSALPKLVARSHQRDFLAQESLPSHDFTILNPPYARTRRIKRFRTADTREQYAYFLERVADDSQGFIAITPASYLSADKYATLREILEQRPGGDVLVLDNVPDTCFRGYKYGSSNTSKTNFVRAAITVSSPTDREWMVTPILRWSVRSRERMWAGAQTFRVRLRHGPNGEWAKVMPGTEEVWDYLAKAETRLGDVVSSSMTPYALDVASTPRYYVSATKRDLQRGSKHTLYFESAAARDRAYVLLNSSLPYWWWRCLNGGVTLSRRDLLCLPIPAGLSAPRRIVRRLETSDARHVVTKLNAGRLNENVRRPRELVDEIDRTLLSGLEFNFSLVYSPDMFGR